MRCFTAAAKGLQDYDERMAILIQVVQGEQYGHYYLPQIAGVAFSRNLYRWSPQIRREDGFVRMVWGLGTRAVDRVGNDYPRLVAISHPLLHPEASTKIDPALLATIRRSDRSGRNELKTLSVYEVLDPHYQPLRYLAQLDQGGYLAPLRSVLLGDNIHNLVLTFDELLRRTPLANRLKNMLNTLEENYQSPVDIEFTAQIEDPLSLQPDMQISLLQCRPQSQ